ncbi:MAG: replication-associated recombination protein A [Prevotella sp.]|nr:replication-associated recombination protein A [Staphylococcus sp.]MCM1349795.1 replication-associated recombination protein A [Prevotella sp.]
MKPLAYLMRPKSFDEIVGQDHLVGQNGVIRNMITSHHLFSFILYGNPGCGKTTIALATCEESKHKYFKFNASIDAKDVLKQVINEARFLDTPILIVDEIHRMKKDIQDFLLPYVEDGTIVMIGLTTVNPYHSVNPAIRSRCHIYRLHDLTESNMMTILKRAQSFIDTPLEIDDDAYQYIISTANLEIRTLINNFESIAYTSSSHHITLELAKQYIQKSNVSIDANGDSYFDTLSGLQKSIRGSDVDAALHYLAKLIIAGDFDSLARRLLAIAYEDIGLANPTIGPRVKAAVDAARELGNPEARLPLSVIVIEMALSPKSNSAYLAIAEAMSDIENGKSGSLPLHLKNTYSFDPKQKSYLYPHDYPNAWVDQQYLPDALMGRTYYHPKNSSKMEIGLKERYDTIVSYRQNAKNKSE